MAGALAAEHGADQPADQQVVAGGEEDGGEDDEGVRGCEGGLWGVAGGLVSGLVVT